jgi:hypothetical protein
MKFPVLVNHRVQNKKKKSGGVISHTLGYFAPFLKFQMNETYGLK